MHHSVLIRIDKTCRSLGAICVCIYFAVGTTILCVRESQAECGRFGLARLELCTHLCEFSLALLIGLNGFSGAGCFLQSALSLLGCMIAGQRQFVKLCLQFA
ncbi:hypothetical protein F5888DRAFT_1686120 [Russula emetica]|nr:hypothetical protein F5888DRAFT_1686120 [Russula emetica]